MYMYIEYVHLYIHMYMYMYIHVPQFSPPPFFNVSCIVFMYIQCTCACTCTCMYEKLTQSHKGEVGRLQQQYQTQRDKMAVSHQQAVTQVATCLHTDMMNFHSSHADTCVGGGECEERTRAAAQLGTAAT